MWKLQPPWKMSPTLSLQHPSKSWGPAKNLPSPRLHFYREKIGDLKLSAKHTLHVQPESYQELNTENISSLCFTCYLTWSISLYEQSEK